MAYTPTVFPLMVPPGFAATRRVMRSNGTPCPTNPGGYRAAGRQWPSERPIIYDAFDEPRGGQPHRALDITCADGTPVVSPVDGVVKMSWRYQGRTLPGAGTSDRGGNYVWIEGADEHDHYFAHLRDVIVRPGQRVVAGQQIGLCSDTGAARGSCPHLHYAVTHKSGAKVNAFVKVKALFDTLGWRGEPKVEQERIAEGDQPGQDQRRLATASGMGLIGAAAAVLAVYMLMRRRKRS